jgi:hypothetical protein
MSFVIEDGKGKGYKAEVNKDNRLLTRAVITDEEASANDQGQAYNVNSGVITLTSGSESSILYIKNTDAAKQIHISAIAIGFGPSTGGVATEIPKVTVIRNPTAGTVVSDATAVDINSNRNFGSSNTLAGDIYKGGEGKTLTDGEDHIIFFQGDNGRLFANIGEVLPNGASLGIKVNPQGSNTNLDCYAALIIHLEDT